MRLLFRPAVLLITGTLALAGSVVAPASAGRVDAAPVLDWSRYATQVIVAGRPPASSEVLLGIVHVAIADTVAGLGYGRPFQVAVRPERKASAAAAVATAAYDVLRARVPSPGLETTYADYRPVYRTGAARRKVSSWAELWRRAYSRGARGTA